MDENTKYILSYLNSKNSTLAFNVSRLLSVKAKKTEYFYYIKNILEMIYSAEKICKKLNIKDIPLNDFCNELLLIQHLDIKEVNEFLIKYKYEKSFVDATKKIQENIQHDIVPKNEDKSLMEFLINNKLINHDDEKEIYEFYIKHILLKETPINYDTFINLMKNYTKLFVQVDVKVSNSKIKKDNVIYLNSDELMQMYNLGYYKCLENIYKNTRLIAQKRAIVSNDDNELINRIIIDNAISEMDKTYIRNNKELLTSYLDSEFYSLNSLEELFIKYNIPYEIKSFNEKKEEYTNLLTENYRMYKGEKINQEELYNLLNKGAKKSGRKAKK